MAQGAVAPGLTNGIKTLTAGELHEILECEKIVRFRDAVLAGTHPRIQVPAQLKPRQTASPVQPAGVQAAAHGESNSTISTAIEIIDTNNSRANTQWSSPGRSAVGKAPQSEINPILLEKSDDLIKAEIQLRRQRLERALREQIEQRRVSLKASLQTSESLPDFDISEVLSKALSIAHSSADVESEQHVGTRTSAASDSFDENTFYSSQHDTPGLSSPSQEGREAVEAEVQQMTTGQSFDTVSNHDRDESHDLVMTGVSVRSEPGLSVPNILHEPSLQRLTSEILHPSGIPGLGSASIEDARQNQSYNLYDKGAPTSSSSSSQMVLDANHLAASDGLSAIPSKAPQDLTDLARVQTGEQLKRKFGEMVESPGSNESSEPAIIQARSDLSPFAPQPARISPLATARGPPILDQTMIMDEAPPAQVAALRKLSVVSTPESSPKGTKTDKKKKKKKTRKSTGKDSTTVDTPNSPYIKPEPLSPSPFSAVPLQRPNKRQRQVFRQGQELNYDEPRYDSSREEQPQRVAPPRYREPEVRPVYDRPEDVCVYEAREADPLGYRQVREDPQYRRVVSHESYRAPRSPEMYSRPYAPQDIRPMKAASHVVSERVEPSRHYRDANLPPGAVRIDLDRERSRSPLMQERHSPVPMAPPPRMAPVRVVVDEYGHKYYAPLSAPAVSRQSNAPSSRIAGEDIIYERPPPRQSVAPTSRNGGDDIVYERPPPRQSFAPSSQTGGEDAIYERPLPRQPVPSSSRISGDEVVYERPPPRLLNRPIAEVYEEDGVLYRRSSPAFAPPRRVVTQPDLDMEYRSYRQREYSARPVAMAPPEEYIRPREAHLRQMNHFDEAPREYTPRVGSVRPDAVRYEIPRIEEVPRDYIPRTGSVRPEGIRYEMPRDYAPRLQSVRPEPLGREYAASGRPEQRIREFSVRPEPRREIIPLEQGVREFSMRPGEGESVRKEYISAPDGNYPAVRPMGRRVADEVEYRERPREVPQDMYDDGARREVVYM